MRTKQYKWFWAWDFDKEEQWLNDMAAKGLALVSVGYCQYTFEECTPGEYCVRLELLENLPSQGESQRYIRFMEEMGVEYLGSIMRWVFFRKKTAKGEFDLYSDCDSRIAHLKRIVTLLSVLTLLSWSSALLNLSIFFGLHHEPFNLGAAIPVLCLGLLVLYGLVKTCLMLRKLKKEKLLFE